MRDKEKLLDYRFMPEPNLPPLYVYSSGHAPPSSGCAGPAVILEEVGQRLPELPGQARERLQQKYGVPLVSASLLVVSGGFLGLHLLNLYLFSVSLGVDVVPAVFSVFISWDDFFLLFSLPLFFLLSFLWFVLSLDLLNTKLPLKKYW